MQKRQENPNRSFGLWLLLGIMVVVLAFITGCAGNGQEASSGKQVRASDTTPSAKHTPSPPDRAGGSKPRKKDPNKKDKKPKEERPLPAPKHSCDDLLVLVDRKNHLPRSYVPKDLVPLRRYGTSASKPRLFLRREAAIHQRALISAARADGERLVVASAFRSYAEQQRTFAGFVHLYGKGANIVSARPGQSQHQLGTAVDFTNAASDYRLLPSFGKTSESQWLKKHAPEYGFVLSYSNSAE